MLEMTYEEFRSSYKRWQPLWKSLIQCLPGRITRDYIQPKRIWSFNWYGIAFQLRFRVPNRCGFFANGPDAIGAQWCWPWRWYRKYYEARISPFN